ncbi:MAG: hypothetical protein J5729_00155 [Bacteroidaceae bacterium]|nr:hypothetical protein [Bacteroidaceae bacterium]
MKRTFFVSGFASLLLMLSLTATADWQMKSVPIKTRWADEVTPDNVLKEYPRPQMVRVSQMGESTTDLTAGVGAWRNAFMEQGSAEAGWINLNGVWNFCTTTSLWSSLPTTGWQEILVPFCTESAMSGIKQKIEHMAYRRTITIPASWEGKRVKLNFGAVDWKCSVWLDGDSVGAHQGGYDPFSIDITAKAKPGTPQQLMVRVYDPTDKDSNPRGKQVSRPGGIFYTSCSGIWQTVWMEAVGKTYVSGLKIVPDLDNSQVLITANATGDDAANATVSLSVMHGPVEVATAEGKAGVPMALKIDNPDLWSPDHPFLYDLRVNLRDGMGNSDEVVSYFGMRKVGMAKEGNRWRIQLNNKTIFQMGCLDQGYWPESNLTPPSEEALKNDIITMKRVGLNMVRKHIKVEPARWYYWCDKLGLMIWQDMPGMNYGGSYKDIPNNAGYFSKELLAMLDYLKNTPSITTWVIFNEAGGQHDTENYVNLIKNFDDTRLVDEASGWNLTGHGDIKDIHSYPAPSFSASDTQICAVGEYGGVQMAVEGHMWGAAGSVYGYVSTPAAYDSTYAAYSEMLFQHKIKSGLSAAVYTQITDVESELNGFMTYDRLMKSDTMNLYRANRHVIDDYADDLKYVMPSADVQPLIWKYTTSDPGEGWESADFDDSGWKSGKAGFGIPGFENMVVNTRWGTSDIWLRYELPLNITEEQRKKLRLKLYHDEDCQIYFNGVSAIRLSGYTTSYENQQASASSRAALNLQGTNTVAVHVKQTSGGQFFDLGIYLDGEKADTRTHELKINLDYSKSSEYSLVVGYATATDAETPDVSFPVTKLPIDKVIVGLEDDLLKEPVTLNYDLTPYFKNLDPNVPVKYFVYVKTTQGDGQGTIHSAELTNFSAEGGPETFKLLEKDSAFAANQSILLSASKGKYTVLQDRLHKLVEQCDTTYISFTTPLLDTEAPYVDGTECGAVTTIGQVDVLGAAVEAGKAAIEREEDSNEVLAPLCDAIEEAYNICMAKSNPIQDGGYYYVISGFAADANTAGTGVAMTYAAGDNYVYKSPMMLGNTAYIFHLTRDGDYWQLQNVGNGKYLSTLEKSNHVWSDTPVNLQILNRFENNLNYWTNDANDNVRKRLCYDICSADGKTHLMGPAGLDVKVTKGTTWWFCAWMFRPVDFEPVPLGDVNRDFSINSADVVTVYNYIILGPQSGAGLTQADVDGNGEVNSADVVALYNIIISD